MQTTVYRPTQTQNQTQNFMEVLSTLSSLSQLLQQAPIENKVSNNNRPSIDEVFKPRIDDLLKETSEWRGRDNIYSHDVYEYIQHGQWEKWKPQLNMDKINERLTRISRLKDVDFFKLYLEFRSELCKRIGITHQEVCMEPQVISHYFEWGYKYKNFSFYKCIEINREYLMKAVDVIFYIEAQNGIYDNEHNHGIMIRDEFKSISRKIYKGEIELSNKEYKDLFECVVKEYIRICKVDFDEATKLAFSFAEKSMKKHRRTKDIFANYRFSGDYFLDMHDVLSNERLREEFLHWAMGAFTDVW